MRSKQLSENLNKVRASIKTYCSQKVTFIAVSKKFPVEDINFLMNKNFAYDNEADDPSDIKAKKLAFKEEYYHFSF